MNTFIKSYKYFKTIEIDIRKNNTKEKIRIWRNRALPEYMQCNYNDESSFPLEKYDSKLNNIASFLLIKYDFWYIKD